MKDDCIICGSSEKPIVRIISNGYEVECIRCGNFEISEDAYDDLLSNPITDEFQRTALAYSIIKNKSFLTTDIIAKYCKSEVPSPIEQFHNLLIHISDETTYFGQPIEIKDVFDFYRFGCSNSESVSQLVMELQSHKYIEIHAQYTDSIEVKLTLLGYKYIDSILKAKEESKQVFMAMKFGESELDDIVEGVFRDAVKDTGFNLLKLNDNNPAGLIDDRMRVEIRKSKFIIADLTHGNNGAYWEAGYAEGLGKQVIYTCRKNVFLDEKNKPHFDTNHHLTILWSSEDPKQVYEDLMACIRATFPDDALL